MNKHATCSIVATVVATHLAATLGRGAAWVARAMRSALSDTSKGRVKQGRPKGEFSNNLTLN